MTNEEIINKVKAWQTSEYLHPLTCTNHHILEPIEVLGKVILSCPSCNYIQEWIPEIVLTNFIERIKKL